MKKKSLHYWCIWTFATFMGIGATASQAASLEEVTLLFRKNIEIKQAIEQSGRSLQSHEVQRVLALLDEARDILSVNQGPIQKEGCFGVGCVVLETVNQWNVRKITHTSPGQVQLDDGNWYKQGDVFPTLQICGRISVNERIIETVNSYNVRKVLFTADFRGSCVFKLDDNSWYKESDLQQLVPQFEEHHIGDEILETVNTWNIRTISEIGDKGLFLLSDGGWYTPSTIVHLVEHFNGYSVGQKVLELVNQQNIRTIKRISKNGNFLLDDGNWYNLDVIRPVR